MFLCGYLFSFYLSQRNVQLASSLEGVVSTAPQLAYRLLASPSKHSNPQYQGSHGTVGSKPINDHMFRYLYRLISVSEIKHWTILVYRISVQNQCQASLQPHTVIHMHRCLSQWSIWSNKTPGSYSKFYGTSFLKMRPNSSQTASPFMDMNMMHLLPLRKFNIC